MLAPRQRELSGPRRTLLIGVDSPERRDEHCVGAVLARKAAMHDFDYILNWKLKAGSHPFPGKDGGTCINEAAIVAAGYPYKALRRAEQMPRCFSRPICRFAMQLNDEASDEERQLLLPFVTRLACADTRNVERARAAYIGQHARPAMTVEEGITVLRGALAIGRQADPPARDEVRSRMDSAREPIAPPRPFARLKHWLAGQLESA
jgi:hypothetical protein